MSTNVNLLRGIDIQQNIYYNMTVCDRERLMMIPETKVIAVKKALWEALGVTAGLSPDLVFRIGPVKSVWFPIRMPGEPRVLKIAQNCFPRQCLIAENEKPGEENESSTDLRNRSFKNGRHYEGLSQAQTVP